MPLSPSAPFKTANVWAAAAAVSLLFAIGLATAPIATADTCDNATLRAQNNSTGLPDCRAYEMVTPPYKEGFDVDYVGVAFRDDGVVSYRTLGSFADIGQSSIVNAYHATRTPAGWAASALAPPGAMYDAGGGSALEPHDLRSSLWPLVRRDLPGDKRGFWLRGLDGTLTRVGDAEDEDGQRLVVAMSDDVKHVVFFHSPQGGFLSDLYEWVGTNNEGLPRAVNVNNLGEHTASNSCANDVSADGRVIVYTAGCFAAGGATELWARVAGSASVAVSGSECTRTADDPGGVCNAVSGASYESGADDGSRVFFTTSRQLVNGDTDQTNDLYACDIPPGTPAPVGVANPCAPLTQVSGAATDAKVEDVAAVSEDGSRVYFVAQGALADNLGVGDVGPATAADFPFGGEPHNLYLWERDDAHPAGQTRFVARLGASDVAGAQMTPDGRYLLFLTASKLVTDGPGKDDDGAVDAYRYDTVTRTIVRVSTSVSGSGGNAPGFDVSLAADRKTLGAGGRLNSSMSADGSTVIFDTAEGLSAADTNGVADVHSWRNGQVSLISAGGSYGFAPGPAIGISPSGRDIFFLTSAQVLPGDINANLDVYTARIGGGFDPPRPPASCSGDGCQGRLSGAPGLAAPRSGLSGHSDPGDATAVLSLRSVTVAQRRAAARTGVLSVLVKSNSTGRLTAIANAKFKGRTRRVAFASPVARRAGIVKIRLSLSSAARMWLRSGQPLRIKLSVTKKGAKKRSRSIRLPGASS